MFMLRYMSYGIAVNPTANIRPFILPAEPKQRWKRESDSDEEWGTKSSSGDETHSEEIESTGSDSDSDSHTGLLTPIPAMI